MMELRSEECQTLIAEIDWDKIITLEYDSGKTIGVLKDLSKNLKTKIHFAVLINKSESKSKVEYYGKTVNSKVNDYWYVFPWENWWKLNEK